MKSLKKLLASVSALAIILSSSATTFAAVGYTDVPDNHWVVPYLETLKDEGVLDTSKTSFQPDANINRAELVKMVVEYNGGVDTATLPTTPSFVDVAKDAWYYGYVETAYADGIVAGYPTADAKKEFRPAQSLTRAEAVKILIEALAVPTASAKAEPYSDVSTEWFASYVTTAYNSCIVKEETSFRPTANITRAEAVKVFAAALDPNTDCFSATSSTPSTSVAPGTSPTASPAAVSDNSIEVSVSKKTPASQTIPRNGYNIPFLTLDITAKNGEDVKLTGVTITSGGLGNSKDITAAKVFDGLEQMGSDRSFASDTKQAPLNLSSEPVVIKAGTTKTVVVKADLAGEIGAEYIFSIDSIAAITAVGATTGGTVKISGSFPLTGERMKVGSVSAGALTFNGKSLTGAADIDIGTNDAQVARFEVAASSAEDVLLQGLKLENQGTANTSDVKNFRLIYSGTTLATADAIGANRFVTFDLTKLAEGGFKLSKGDTRTMEVIADIVDGSTRTVKFGFNQINNEVVATGLTYNFPVQLTQGSTVTYPWGSISIRGGDINFALNSTARDVAPNAKKVEFGTLTISNAGEDIDVKQLQLTLTPASGGSAEDYKNIKLIDATTKATVFGPTDGTTAGAGVPQSLLFTDSPTIASGKTVTLSLIADVANTAVAGQTVYFTLDMGVVKVRGLTTGYSTTGTTTGQPHKIRPTSSPSTKLYTIASAGVSVTPKTLAAQYLVSRTSKQVFWRGTIRANSAEDVSLKSISFTQTITGADASQDNVQNLVLRTVSGTTLTTLDQGRTPDSAGVVPFNSFPAGGLKVPAGSEVTIELAGDVASNLVGTTPTSAFNLSAITVENLEGNAATVATTLPTTGGAVFSLVGKGAFYAKYKSADTPDSQILLAGSTTPYSLGAYEFEAKYENISVKQLAVSITGAGPNDYKAVNSVALYYKDSGATVLKTSGQAASTDSITTAGLGILSDLSLTVDKTAKTVVLVKATIADISSTGVATSGMNFVTALRFNQGATPKDFDIVGADSGSPYLTVDSTGTVDITTDIGAPGAEKTTDAKRMYVYNNKVIATKSAGQGTSLANGEKELLKFTLTPSGDGTTKLKALTAIIDLNDAGVAAPALSISGVTLYSGSTVIGTSAATGGTTAFTITTPDEINSAGETYTIKATIAGAGDKDKITTRININADAPASDGITWTDYGTNGTDGADVQWIDLGSDTVTSSIENAIAF